MVASLGLNDHIARRTHRLVHSDRETFAKFSPWPTPMLLHPLLTTSNSRDADIMKMTLSGGIRGTLIARKTMFTDIERHESHVTAGRIRQMTLEVQKRRVPFWDFEGDDAYARRS